MSGRYASFAKYFNSDQAWLGQVPQGWTVSRLKRVAGIAGRIGFRGYTTDDIVDEGEGAIALCPSNVLQDKLSLEKRTYLSWSKYYESPEIMAEDGDILLVKTGSVGKVAYLHGITEPMTINPQMVLLKRSRVDPKFLAYFLSTSLIKAHVDIVSSGSTMPTMTQASVGAFPVVCPPGVLSSQISKFLDYQTASIDALVRKQQQLINLLKEKRQTVISHAVTKGLNPDAPTRDSGVEWLGKVPAHWTVRSLKQSIRPGSSVSYGIVQPGEPLDNGVAFVQTTNMSRGTLELGALQRTSALIASAYPRSRLTGGEVILGIRASIGAAHIVPTFLRGCNLSRGVARILPSKDLTSEFLVWYFRSQVVAHYWGLSSQGSTFSEVSIDTVKKIFVPIPPTQEQRVISSFIGGKTARLDDLIGKAEEQNILLQERRAALISAAVTGKIDVSDWKPPAPSTEEEAA